MKGVQALCCTALMALILASPIQASLSFSNGSFETTTNGTGQLTFNTSVTGWTSVSDGAGHDGYNFLFASGTADSTGAIGADGALTLWGPNDGSANGLPASSPDGGNYIAADGAYEVGAISQQVTGLIVNDSYTLSFYWAGAQQSGFTGPNTEGWDVSFGGVTQDTTILNNTSEGFTGWQKQTFTFVANSTSELLSFLAVGTPGGEPPFSLLDGVSLAQSTPEPETYALIGLGLLAIPLASKLLKKRSALEASITPTNPAGSARPAITPR
jgi:hypothetical protein